MDVLKKFLKNLDQCYDSAYEKEDNELTKEYLRGAKDNLKAVKRVISEMEDVIVKEEE